MTKRQCMYVDETMATEGGFIPALVTEDEPGYAPMSGNGDFASPWVWGPTIQDAKRQCDDYNEKLGITRSDAAEIVLSSMDFGRR